MPGDAKLHKLEHVLTPRSESGIGLSASGSDSEEEQARLLDALTTGATSDGTTDGHASAALASVSSTSMSSMTVTCDIPQPWTRAIADIEVSVNAVFSVLQQDLDAGTIVVGDKAERFLVFRANALTMDFFQAVSTALKFETDAARLTFAQNLLFDFGADIGKCASL